jgi:hypothetical protein
MEKYPHLHRWYGYSKLLDFRFKQFILPFWAVDTIKVGKGQNIESSYNQWYIEARNRHEKRLTKFQ